MNILLDTDILIDVALKREAFFSFSASVINTAEKRDFSAFIAWHSISNFYYLVSSPGKKNKAKLFIKELLEFVQIAPTVTSDAKWALSLDLPDFEDALQVSAASACHAQMIITRNIKHYKKSPIRAITPEDFLKSH